MNRIGRSKSFEEEIDAARAKLARDIANAERYPDDPNLNMIELFGRYALLSSVGSKELSSKRFEEGLREAGVSPDLSAHLGKIRASQRDTQREVYTGHLTDEAVVANSRTIRIKRIVDDILDDPDDIQAILFGLGPAQGPADLLPEGGPGLGVFEDMGEGQQEA